MLQKLIRENASADSGHHYIGKQQINRLLVFADSDRLSAALGFEHPVSAYLQKMAAQFPQRDFILDEQHCFISLRRGHTRVDFLDLFPRLDLRQVDFETSTCPRFADNVNVSAALLHDSVDHRQTKSCSLAFSFVVKNGSKIRARVAASIPTPLSLTVRRT